MPVSDYIRNLRTHVGHALLLLPGVAAVIHNAAGAVLLVRRADDGEWGLPAGAIDPGECPAQAVVREVWEETGLRVRPVRVIGVFGGEPLLRTTYPNGDQCEYTVIVYFCEVVGGELRARDGEASGFAYVPLDRLADYGVRYPSAIYAAGDGPAMFQWSERWIPRDDGMESADSMIADGDGEEPRCSAT